MSDWEKACNPYDLVAPSGSGFSEVQPKSQSKSWVWEIKPGGDNYFQGVGSANPCWDKQIRMQHVRQIEGLHLEDLGGFHINTKLERKAFVGSFKDYAAIWLYLKPEEFVALKEKVLGTASIKSLKEILGNKTEIILITLQFIFGQEAIRNLDRFKLVLYTKSKDEIRGYDSVVFKFEKEAVESISLLDFLNISFGYSMLGYSEGGYML